MSPPIKEKSVQDYSGAPQTGQSPEPATTPTAEVATASVERSAPVLSKDEERLWKVRNQTSKQYIEKSDHYTRMKRMRDVIDGEMYETTGDTNDIQVPFRQHKIALKSRVPSLIYQDPEASVESTNDVIYEYDEAGQRKIDPQTGLPIKHDMTKVGKTLTALLQKKMKGIMWELRSALKHGLAYNRGIFLVGHTLNTAYEGSNVKDEMFHPFIKSVSPFKVRRQPGTSRIDEGLFAFYDYQMPMSFLVKMYDPELLAKCRPGLVGGLSIDKSLEDLQKNVYDDVKWLSMHNAYDLETGRVLVFGEGYDQPLHIAEPGYDFKNPITEWIPNDQFSLDCLEPASDLMDADEIIMAALKLFNKLCADVMNYNHGLDVEEKALTAKMRKRLEKAKNRAVRVFNDGALQAGKVKPRQEADIPQGALAVLNMLSDMADKTLQAYDFMQAGGGAKDEKATKTALKGQYASAAGGDTANTFAGACNLALEKFLHVCLKTTTEKEVVKIVGDKGEVEYPEIGPEFAEGIQYYVKVNLESAQKKDNSVRIQQASQLYEITSKDQDPKVQQIVDKAKLLRKVADALQLGDVIKATPDTQGMSEEEYGAYLAQQHEKAQMENRQASLNAPVLPPTQDDDDDVHLSDHIGAVQQGNQAILAHAQLHIARKKAKEERETGVIQPPPAPQVSPNPPTEGQIQGQANKVAGAPPGLPQGAEGGAPTGGM